MAKKDVLKLPCVDFFLLLLAPLQLGRPLLFLLLRPPSFRSQLQIQPPLLNPTEPLLLRFDASIEANMQSQRFALYQRTPCRVATAARANALRPPCCLSDVLPVLLLLSRLPPLDIHAQTTVRQETRAMLPRQRRGSRDCFEAHRNDTGPRLETCFFTSSSSSPRSVEYQRGLGGLTQV